MAKSGRDCQPASEAACGYVKSSLAFWNNPIVISAFRVRSRRGGLFTLTALYVLALSVGGAVLEYFSPQLNISWARAYYLILMGIQFFLSCLIAVSETSSSIRNEVVNQTLDFQRLTALSPRQILLGKLLGEPALAYLLAVATVPLAVICWLGGGVPFDVMILMYLNLATTTLMFGAMGLVPAAGTPQRQTGRGQRGRPRDIGGVCLFRSATIFFPALFSMGAMSKPWTTAVLGLATPVPLFQGIPRGDPWQPLVSRSWNEACLCSCLLPCRSWCWLSCSSTSWSAGSSRGDRSEQGSRLPAAGRGRCPHGRGAFRIGPPCFSPGPALCGFLPGSLLLQPANDQCRDALAGNLRHLGVAFSRPAPMVMGGLVASAHPTAWPCGHSQWWAS